MLTPARRRGTEFLDDPDLDPAIATRSLRDVALSNRLFGGCRAVLAELDGQVRALAAFGATSATLLDVGTGLGDIPRAARALATAHGIRLHTIGLEMTAPLAQAARPFATTAVAGDARALPFADRSVDLITCSQVLHHLDGDDARRLLAELSRVARCGVIVSDLRRSWLAAGLLWCVSFPLGFHPVSRHDGVTSIFRGFTRHELAVAVREATGVAPSVRHRLGWRVTARWSHSSLAGT
jgi:SAM-dependent methyltransferase